MIHYNISLKDIKLLVDATVPNWQRRAWLRTQKLIRRKSYYEKTQIWSEVKPIFAEFQHQKCIFCEQKLEGGQTGYIQHDLEHFRPKGTVEPWPVDKAAYGYTFSTGDRHAAGYYLLAYHLGNYASACKVCNTLFKLNFFPIAGTRIQDGMEPSDYASENAYLIYPIGDKDTKPTELITFVGYKALPVHEVGPEYERARVIIDFLGLNREWLQYSRSWALLAVWETWQNYKEGKPFSERTLNSFSSEYAPHTNCVNAFLRLCETDVVAARALVPMFQNKIEEEIKLPENKHPNK
jgi:hypothetical protein